MRLLDRLINLVRGRPEGQRVFVGRRQGGVIVTEDTAGTYSAVAACERIISETMAAIPWQVFRRAESGREALPKNPVQWLLNFQANPEHTAYIFKRTLLSNYLMWGTGYAEIEESLSGQPVWLWWLPPDRTTLQRSETGELNVRCAINGQQFVLPREKVYMLSDASFDGLTGVSRIARARRAIGAGMAQDVFAASFFQNGASVGGIITQKSGKTLTPEAREELLQSFDERYAGPDKASKTYYVDGGMEYAKAGAMPLGDAQFIENRIFQIREIARWYGVPLHLLQDLAEANYAISFESSKNFVEHTLRPIAVLMEQEANVRLFGQRSQNNIYSRMNLSALMRADPKMRGEWYRALVNSGVMSINEVRELEELNSIGPLGDDRYMQINMTTIERVADGATVGGGVAGPVAEPNDAPADPAPQPDNVIRREALAWWRAQQSQERANG
jgi:HK97 family phage portal protein